MLLPNIKMKAEGSPRRGFTLIELMVTMAIFVIMTALIMARYNSFYSGTIFTNIAYDIALTIRQAQTYGISVKVGDRNPSTFGSAYGVAFQLGTGNKNFILYRDIDGRGYTNDMTDPPESTYSIKQGAYISYMCVGTSAVACTSTGKLSIIFLRPNPEPQICGVDTSDCGYKYAEITITAGDEVTKKKVIVNPVGQVSIADA